MFSPIVQNQENVRSPEEDKVTLTKLTDENDNQPKKVTDKEVDDNKTGPEKDNFKNAKKKDLIFPLFNRNQTLPKSLRTSLTSRAQTFWREGYNLKIQKTHDADEAISFAWLEVEKKYKKVSGKWILKTKK